MIYSCENCGRQCLDKGHHKFSQTKANLKKYGNRLIHDRKNIKHLCPQCHGNLKTGDKYTEREFIKAMGLLSYCKKKINCFKYNFPSELKCEDCREYEFDKEYYYSKNKVKENSLESGSYGYQE